MVLGLEKGGYTLAFGLAAASGRSGGQASMSNPWASTLAKARVNSASEA